MAMIIILFIVKHITFFTCLDYDFLEENDNKDRFD